MDVRRRYATLDITTNFLLLRLSLEHSEFWQARRHRDCYRNQTHS